MTKKPLDKFCRYGKKIGLARREPASPCGVQLNDTTAADAILHGYTSRCQVQPISGILRRVCHPAQATKAKAQSERMAKIFGGPFWITLPTPDQNENPDVPEELVQHVKINGLRNSSHPVSRLRTDPPKTGESVRLNPPIIRLRRTMVNAKQTDAIVTRYFLESGKSPRGGWSSQQLAILGVKWPPARGWQRRCIGRKISANDAERFLSENWPKDSEKMHRKRNGRARKSEKRARISDALASISWIITEALKYGLEVRYTYQKHGGTLHVMFDSRGTRVLNWWPATGTTIDYKGVRCVAGTPERAIHQASLALERMPDGETVATTEASLETGRQEPALPNDETCPFDLD